MAPNMLPIYTCHWYQITLSCLPLPSPLYSHASSCSSSRSSTRVCCWYVFMYLRSNATEVPDLLHLVMVLSNRPCWGRKNSIPSHSFGKSLPAVRFALHLRHWYYSTSLHLRKLNTCLLFWLMWYSFLHVWPLTVPFMGMGSRCPCWHPKFPSNFQHPISQSSTPTYS